MSIIDNTYFITENNLPVDNINIQSFIDKHEPEILKKIFGYALYKDFIDGLAVLPTPDQKWLDLRDGSEYTYDGELNKYEGIQNIIADWVYYWITRSEKTTATDSGIKRANVMNMENTDPKSRQVYSYNEMVDQIVLLNEFILANNESVADTYENYETATFKKNNVLNI